MQVLGIIPARSGSKRVKGKNIRPLAGKPLIQYTIEAAAHSRQLADFLVSTDSEAIRAVAERAGAAVPFLRPASIAADHTGDRPVLIHAVRWYQAHHAFMPDAVMLLRPTTPFKTAGLIDQAIELLQRTGADSVRSMTQAEGVYHPYWMFRKSGDHQALPFDEKHTIEQYYQSNLLPPLYRLNGVVDVIKTSVLLNEALPLYGKDMRLLQVPEYLSMDIDTEFDFQLCEMMMAAKESGCRINRL